MQEEIKIKEVDEFVIVEKEDQEEVELRQFLTNSFEFKKLKEIAAAHPNCQRFSQWITGIGKSSKFYDILDKTSDVDPQTTDNLMAYNLGRKNVNAALFLVGFFNNDANFTYYLLNLRLTVEAYLNKHSRPFLNSC